MSPTKSPTRRSVLAAAAVAAGSGSLLSMPAAATPGSQEPGIKRTILLRQDLDLSGREVVQVRVDFGPGLAFPAHSHPGEEIAYVIEGLLEYQFEEKPPVTLKPGEVLFIPAGTSHSAKNVGTGNAAELATYIVEKGKPLVTLTHVSVR